MTAALDRRRIIAVTGLAFEARMVRGAGILAMSGGGDVARLRSCLDREASKGAFGLISFGIAGGLVVGAATGAWVIGARVVQGGTTRIADREWVAALARRLPGATIADIAGSDDVVAEPGAKRTLHAASGASIVDTESHVVAEIAHARGLPFAAFRVVSDPVDRALPEAARVGLKPNGGVAFTAVARSLVRAPVQIASLARAALDAAVALRALSEGRRRLGAGLAYPDFDELLLDVT